MASHGCRPVEVSFPLPKAPETRIHLQLTIQLTSLLLFLTTRTNRDTPGSTVLGSFVYALPDKLNPGQTLSTPLYINESTLEFTTRLAKLLARKTGKPVYVGNSISFANAGMGGTVEEEMEGFKKVVEVVTYQVRKSSMEPFVYEANGRSGALDERSNKRQLADEVMRRESTELVRFLKNDLAQ